MIDFIKQRYQEWRDLRFLRRHGCRDWWEYHRRYDPDYNCRADRLQDVYHGYAYRHVFERSDHHCYRLLWDLGPGGHRYGYFDIVEWCKTNCQGKFRHDLHRMFQQTPVGLEGPEEPEWWINEIGGYDYLVMAFQDERDYLMFRLRWS